MDPILGEIKLFALPFAPRGWHLCDGTLLQIKQNAALYALLGVKYGGDGVNTFGLPDLRGRVPAQATVSQPLGTKGGNEGSTLLQANVPKHSHPVNVLDSTGSKPNGLGNHIAAAVTRVTPPANVNLYAPANSPNQITLNAETVGVAGAGAPHNNMQPYLVLNYCIAIQGAFPLRN